MRHRLIVIGFLISILSLACKAPAPRRYVTPEAHLNKKSAEMGTPIEIEYSFSTDEDFPGFRKDLTVFVHFLDPEGKIRFVDDHFPPVRTNQWVLSQKYNYTRTVFIPENLNAGKYTVALGLYLPEGKGEWIELNAKKITSRSYDVGNLRIDLTANSNVQFLEGWHAPEQDPAENFYHWRWTQRKAVLRVPNPASDSILYLRADSDPSKFPNPQKVTLRVNGVVLEEFLISGNEEFVKKYSLAKQQLGLNTTVDLEVEVDQTFVPASKGTSKDSRELGLRILNFYLGKSREA